MTRTHLFNGVLLAAAALSLAACGGHKSTPVATVSPPAAKIEDSFGSGFATAYRMAANTEPSKPDSTGFPALSLTTEPMALHP